MNKNYILCTTQRSGKTLIARTLRCLKFGNAEEYFIPLHDRSSESLFATKLREAFDSGGITKFVSLISAMQVGENECIGMAVQWNQLSFLSKKINVSGNDLFLKINNAMRDPVVFFIVREGIIEQAISHYLMHKTKYAHSFDDPNLKEFREKVEYNGDEILKFIEMALIAYESWYDLFNETGAFVVPIFYEKLIVDTVKGFKNIINHISSEIILDDDQITSCSQSLSKVGDHVNIKMKDLLCTDDNYRSKVDELVIKFQMLLQKIKNKSTAHI